MEDSDSVDDAKNKVFVGVHLTQSIQVPSTVRAKSAHNCYE